MSQKAVDDLISRMATDPGFHALVRSDPATALAGLDLTEDERTLLLALAPDHDEHVTRLAPRSSKSALFFGTALHDAAATPAHGAASSAAHLASSPPAAAAVGHAAAGASPVEQAITWASAMDPGAADEEAEAVAGATNVLQAGGPAAEEAEEEVADTGSPGMEGGAPA